MFYSQNGEDYILNQLFKDKDNGVFAEIGCIDGLRFSNTLYFEEKGWTGVCVEAHKGYIDMLRKNRPRSIVVHAAVSETNQDSATFFANSRGSLSTLDPGMENEFKTTYGKYFTGFESQTVPMKTLQTIFGENGIENIDILSLDIEGFEVEAVKGLDLSIHQPGVMVVESDSTAHERRLDRLILPHGYKKTARVSKNIFYCHPRIKTAGIENKRFWVNVCHTAHPLDDTGDKNIKRLVDTRLRVPTGEKIKSRLAGLAKKISFR